MKEVKRLNDLDQLLEMDEGEVINLINEDNLIIGIEKIFCLTEEYIAVSSYGSHGRLYNTDTIEYSDFFKDMKNEFQIVDFCIVD